MNEELIGVFEPMKIPYINLICKDNAGRNRKEKFTQVRVRPLKGSSLVFSLGWRSPAGKEQVERNCVLT